MIAKWQDSNEFNHYLQVSGGISAEVKRLPKAGALWVPYVCGIPLPSSTHKGDLHEAIEFTTEALREHLRNALAKL